MNKQDILDVLGMPMGDFPFRFRYLGVPLSSK